MTIFRQVIKSSLRAPVNILVILCLPIVCIFVPKTFEVGFPMGLYIYGLIVLFSAFLLSRPLIEDRINKTIVRIAASPTSYYTYLISHLLAYLAIIGIQNLLFTIGIYLYWQENINSYIYIFILYLIFSVLTISFCLFWNSLFKSYNISMSLFSGIATILALFGGLTIDLRVFPDFLTKIIMILPTYWLRYGLDRIYDNQLVFVFLSIGIMIVYSGVFILTGSKRRF